MLDWLKHYVFIPAWASPIIALVALIRKKSDPANPVNWSQVMMYVGFLTGLAILVTPGMEGDARGIAGTLVAFGFGAFMVQSSWNRK